MNTIPKIFACFSILLLAACVTDPEKTKQSEVDPEMKDTTLKYEKIGARDGADGDTTSTDRKKQKYKEQKNKLDNKNN